jgi:hypothetical protein
MKGLARPVDFIEQPFAQVPSVGAIGVIGVRQLNYVIPAKPSQTFDQLCAFHFLGLEPCLHRGNIDRKIAVHDQVCNTRLLDLSFEQRYAISGISS